MMRLKEIQIHNYKSLRNITLSPTALSALVGPNASGKSNFVDALDFLGNVYRSGLEMAVVRKGGYENICYRRARRSAGPIRFQVKVEIEWQDLNRLAQHGVAKPETFADYQMIFDYIFEFLAKTQAIQAPFHIEFERFEAFLIPKNGTNTNLSLVRVVRKEGKLEDFDATGLEKTSVQPEVKPSIRYIHRSIKDQIQQLSETKLMLPLLNNVLFGTGVFQQFQERIAGLRVFQLNPKYCREAGVPTPNPELDRFGGNLPAVIAYLKANYPEQYTQLLHVVKRVMPNFEDLETYYTPQKTLGLSVKEKSFGRPWVTEDISDGTIQTVALLAAIFDPRIPVVVIEEPENSIHSWAIRNFAEAAREASKNKLIILTTHSPILIDQLKPEEVWIVSRPETETKIIPMLDLAPSLADEWGQGHYTLFEYLDSGMMPEAVPAA